MLDANFRFRNFPVYNDTRSFIKEVKILTKKKLPAEQNFSLKSQLWRALDSVVLNIAEGSGRGTDKDFAHFLNQAHTSLLEVVACFDIACDNQYLTSQEGVRLISQASLLSDQLTAFRRSLLKNPTK